MPQIDIGAKLLFCTFALVVAYSNNMQQYFLDETVKVGKNVTLEPFCVVRGNSVLGDNCVVGSFCYIENSIIGKNSKVKSSRICDSSVGDDCTVGPNAHLRDGATIGDNCRIGDFVEVKNSTLGTGIKAAHLAYIGDAQVGDGTNIGCGVIFVNFDGKTKFRTTVGRNCFIGCNSNLVAPLNIGDNVYVACGTTVDKNVPEGAFGIGRSYLTVKEGKAEKYLK